MAPTVTVKTRRPRHWRDQFRDAAPTKSADCGVWAALNTLEIITGGASAVEADKASGREAVAEMREWMNVPKGPTSTDDWHRAFTGDGIAAMLSVVGLQMPKVYRLSGARFSRIRDHLELGHVVMLCVDYGVLRKGQAPVDGSGFGGGHALAFSGAAIDGADHIWSLDMDSLLSGPRTVRVGWYRDAAGRFGAHPWGIGAMEALAIGHCAEVDVPDVDPDLAALRGLDAQAAGIIRATSELRASLAPLIKRHGG